MTLETLTNVGAPAVAVDCTAMQGCVDDLGLVLLTGPHAGAGTVVQATNAPGTVVHRTSARADVFDQMFLRATNAAAVDEILVITWGVGSAITGMAMRHLPPCAVDVPIQIDEHLSGDGSQPSILRAFATRAGAVIVYGECFRKGPAVVKQ